MKININIELIKKYIKENNLTKKSFSKLCDISYTTLIKILNNNTNINTSSIYKIAIYTQIKLSKLVTYEKNL